MKELKAFCASIRCMKPNTTVPVEKQVTGKPDNCPDCNYALVWRKDRNEMRYLCNRKPKKPRVFEIEGGV